MARPQGRPLAEHVWRDGGWYHAVTGKSFNEEVYIAGVLRRQAACERRRYWDDASGARKRRLLRSMRESAKRPRKRLAAVQLTLHDVPHSNVQLPHVLKLQPHQPQDDIITSCGGEGLAVLHGHAQDSVA